MTSYKIKKEYYQCYVPTTENFSIVDKIIIQKAVAAFYLQENVYYNAISNEYDIKWTDILPLMLTNAEKNSGMGCMMLSFPLDMGSLQDIFNVLFTMPKFPSDLSENNWKHRESLDYKLFQLEYNREVEKNIRHILKEWDKNKENFFEKL